MVLTMERAGVQDMPRRVEEGQTKKRAQMTVVFPEPQDMTRLEAVARRKRLPASILVRMWVMEQVEREESEEKNEADKR
jgi:hypothetical protein